MKKALFFIVCIFFVVGLPGYLISVQATLDNAGIYAGAHVLPSFFPENSLFITLWFVFIGFAGVALWQVLTDPVQANRRKNVFINFLIFLGLLFSWAYLLFSVANFTGVLVVSIAALVLGLLVFVMMWLINHKAGYTFFPTLCWVIFLIILSISLKVLN